MQAEKELEFEEVHWLLGGGGSQAYEDAARGGL